MIGADKRKTFGNNVALSRSSAQTFASTTTMKTPTRSRLTTGGVPPSTRKDTYNQAQARFSFGGAPPSTKRHSIFKSLSSGFKDSRPISSKDYQTEMIHKIADFLLEHDGESCIPEKSIRQPMKQDFINIFESIYQHLNPDFQLRKENEEVPNIFRELGYPVTIKASTMQTIGASHSWPTLLAALTWLIDLVSTIKSLEGQAGQQLLLGGDNSSGTIKAYRYSWLNAAYKEYTHNRDALQFDPNYFDGKVTLLRQWYEQQEDIDGQLRSVQATLVQIQKECAELEADKGNEMKIREDIARMEDDIRKATNYKNEMEADEEQLTAALKNVEQDFSVVRNQVDELRAKVENQKRIIADQATGERGIKGSDARAIMVEYDQNKMYLRELQGEMEELSKEHWLNVPKANNTFTQEQSRYLKILSEVKNIRTEVLKEDTSFFECAPKDIRALQSAVAKDSKNILDDTRNELENAMRTTECAIKAAQQRKENVVGTAQVEQEKLSERERMESRAERQRKREKEEWLKERQILEGEIDGLENQKEILENKQHEVGALEQNLTLLKRDYEETIKSLHHSKLAFDQFLLDRFLPIGADLDAMKNSREWMSKALRELSNSNYNL